MKEIRKLDMQFRAENSEDGKMEIKGYAAVFNSPETYGYTELISERAFDEADMSDVVLRYNHNDSFMVLARTRNKSLELNVDEKGLFIDATLQEDITDHKNIFNAIKSGLIDKQSFAFVVDEDEYDYDTDTRTITKIGKVYDVSVVDQPFYNATDVSVARDLDNNEFLTKREELRKEHEEKIALEEKRKAILEKLG
ncbi:MAG: HK97 family phage prohead protease [Bacilli bacterium]|nr:HK97 family phage prohead protease [Bacilli bacterium]MBR6690768.1 HK97 family phage prohead protease [Bacilli bacterium]